MTQPIYTIGHSNHTQEELSALLSRHSIGVVCDVRSQPYSRVHPHFSREHLIERLKVAGLSYVFLGNELGGRSADPDSYVDGVIQYPRVARTAGFQAGLRRLMDGAGSYRVVILCAEKDPLVCHRTLLVARELARRHIDVQHILSDGSLETQEQAEARLLKELDLAPQDMFRSRAEILEEAYAARSAEVGYRLPEATTVMQAFRPPRRL